MIVSPLRVYISSSWSGDLDDERFAAEELIKSGLLMFPIYPKHAAIRDVPSEYFKIMNGCDLVIVLLGGRYSEHVNNEINYAFKNKMPVLCFIKDCEKDEMIGKEIDDLENNRIITRKFNTVEDLNTELKEAILNLLSTKFKDYIEIERSLLGLINGGRIEILKPKPLQSEYIGV